jgi:hypothetical protein
MNRKGFAHIYILLQIDRRTWDVLRLTGISVLTLDPQDSDCSDALAVWLEKRRQYLPEREVQNRWRNWEHADRGEVAFRLTCLHHGRRRVPREIPVP